MVVVAVEAMVVVQRRDVVDKLRYQASNCRAMGREADGARRKADCIYCSRHPTIAERDKGPADGM